MSISALFGVVWRLIGYIFLSGFQPILKLPASLDEYLAGLTESCVVLRFTAEGWRFLLTVVIKITNNSFTAKFDRERILKISQHLAKLWTNAY